MSGSHRCCVCGTSRQTLYYCRPRGEERGVWACAAHVDPDHMTFLLSSSTLPKVMYPDSERRLWPVTVPPSKPPPPVDYDHMKKVFVSPEIPPPVCATSPDVQSTLRSAKRTRL